MKGLKLSIKLFYLLSGAFLFANCANNYTPPTGGSTAQSVETLTVSEVTDFGIQSDGQIHFQMYGEFIGSNDMVEATCTGEPGSTIAGVIVSDAPTQILFTINPTLVAASDSCTFVVQNSNLISPPSTTVAVSSGQQQLAITEMTDVGPDQNITGDDDIVILGNFQGAGDQVYQSCTGGYFSQVTSVTSDTPTEIDVVIPTPANFLSCQFYVIGNTVQTPTFAALGVVTATDLGPDAVTADNDDIVLTGGFVGINNGADQVFASCDGGGYAQATTVLLDSQTKMKILIPTPVNFDTCSFYIVGTNSIGSVTSSTYNLQ